MGHSSDRDPEPFFLWRVTGEQTREYESSPGANWPFRGPARVGMRMTNVLSTSETHRRGDTLIAV